MTRLATAGVPAVLGGSGLLAAHGLVDHVGDWDITTEGEVAAIAALFADRPHEICGNSGIHADHKVRLAGGVVEIICGFAIRSGDAVVRIPTLVSARAEGIPLGSPEAWAVAYALLGRVEKSERLLR